MLFMTARLSCVAAKPKSIREADFENTTPLRRWCQRTARHIDPHRMDLFAAACAIAKETRAASIAGSAGPCEKAHPRRPIREGPIDSLRPTRVHPADRVPSAHSGRAAQARVPASPGRMASVPWIFAATQSGVFQVPRTLSPPLQATSLNPPLPETGFSEFPLVPVYTVSGAPQVHLPITLHQG